MSLHCYICYLLHCIKATIHSIKYLTGEYTFCSIKEFCVGGSKGKICFIFHNGTVKV